MSQNLGYSDVGDAKLVTLFGLSQIKNVGDKMFETVIPISKLSPTFRIFVINIDVARIRVVLTLAERAVQTHFSGEIQIPSLPQLTFSQIGVTHCGSLESHPEMLFRKL